MEQLVNPFAGQFDSHDVVVNGLLTHYTEWNPAGERVLVLLHGLNVQLHTWDPISAELARDFRVLSMDLRGHGDSAWAADGYGLESFVDDLTGFVDALSLTRFDIIGHSLGARVALGYGSAHPEVVGRIVLSDSAPAITSAAVGKVREIVGSAGDARGFASQEDALRHFERLHPEWQPIFRELHVVHQLRENWAGQLVFKSDPELFWRTLPAIAAHETQAMWEMSERMVVPTLVLAGEAGGFLDEAIADRLRTSSSAFSVEWVKTGHYIPREAPETFIGFVRTFLSAAGST